ncbi:PQQ-binding-like beta-propeller repeat protein [Nocardiopsis valliformis]|uniref:PQQ-binding-like beta-propeller repeat protein n=1 Tax=Nocardiopsis valliformis TaxID=239974 RepID=UPI00037CD7F0|nr:PQQ-binding-like beta-propeller repeat protein [Nocardiopsis valliformis]
MRWISADTLWRLISWAGTGAVLGGVLALVGAALLSPAERWGETSPLLHWGLGGAIVLLTAAWALPGGEHRPGSGWDRRPGEGSGPLRAAAVLVGCLAVLVALREVPGARTPVRASGEGEPLPDVLVDFGAVSHLWYLSALTLLAGALMLAVAGRPEPLRPASGRPRIQAVSAGLAPAVALAVLAVPPVWDRDPSVHTLAEPLASAEAAASVHGDEVTWVWEHPEAGSAGEISVAATDTGALIHGPRGVWALDSRDGSERWRFQPVGEVLWSEPTPDGERVAVLYRDETGADHEQRSVAVLAADTGRPVGYHRIRDEADRVLLTDRAFLQVEESGRFTLRDHESGEANRYQRDRGCVQTGAPVIADARILVPEECPPDEDDAESAEEESHQLRVLTEAGGTYGRREIPGPVEQVLSAPDGWAVVVHYGGDDPGVLAVRSRNRGVTAENLPTEPGRVVPVNGELLMYTETDEDTDQVEYRLERPVVGEPGGDIPDTETVDSLVFATPAPVPESVAVSPELFAGVRAEGPDGNEPAVLLVGAWGADGIEVPLDSAAEGLAPDGSTFGVALAPHAIVVSGFSVGDRAQVIGVGSGSVS